MKVDTISNELMESHFVGPHRFAGEPLFVPAAAATAEDQGWLLVMVYDGKAECTELHVFDAQARLVSACY